MARIAGFVLSISKTINLGDWNSIKVGATVTIEMAPDDDLEAAKTEAQAELGRMMSETYRAQRRQAPGEGQA